MQSPPPLRSLSIVLPCYNEEANVERAVRTALGVGRRIALDLELIVVDDGSRDRTPSVGRRLAAEIPELVLISHGENQGYGAALASGFRAATKELVFYTDADGQFDIGELVGLLPLLDDHDVITGYRRDRRDGRLRVVNGWLFTRIVNGLFDLDLVDVNCAFKLYPRHLFDHADLASKGALIDAECLALSRRAGLKIAQVPVSHFPRAGGRATGGQLHVIARAGIELLALVLRQRRRLSPRAPLTRASLEIGS